MASAAEGIELTAVAGELLALALDDVGGRARDEALVAEHPLGARDLSRRRSISASAFPLPPRFARHDRLEDPALLAFERDEDAASPVGGGRVLDALECAARPRNLASGSGQGATISRVSRDGRLDQISSVT